MSSSGLIYAVIVGAWAAYLVPMWLRRQDELNEARPTERFSTAIRLLSGRAGMERRYAKDLKARSEENPEPPALPGDVTDSVDVRAFAVPPKQSSRAEAAEVSRAENRRSAAREEARDAAPREPEYEKREAARESAPAGRAVERRPRSAQEAARARRTQVLARRRRTTVLLFVLFTAGAVVAAIGGLAFLWAPVAPALLLSVYIVYLRVQERRRFAYVMDRRRAEEAAQRLRERQASRRGTGERRGGELPPGAGESTGPELPDLAADRRALVEQTDHAEWVDQQRERRGGPARGESWDPVPVPLPTYVTAPVAPRATGSTDLGAPDTWSAARSSAAEPGEKGGRAGSTPAGAAEGEADGTDAAGAAEASGERSDARRAASARRARERGRTPLFDQFDEDGRPRAANE
ncbi:gephyrin-like molybdotransferase receptor GlpR [Streptomyces sp. SCSIO ZS0520]|uniref:divisome protein SepX/GlpR n=1 Tax=Streptomyces sp. SCSIO ZS0520 TaxID=2892996 RepID=UPI0021D8C994|nr:gephyrin-like molybdotransferase receptor GlpR [Streptomyces sp. SCSIO ZS0520]